MFHNLMCMSSCCGYSERRLQAWLKTADEAGWEALRKKPSGRPNKLTSQQIEEIKASVNEGAEKFGYKVWNGRVLSDFIKTRYGIDYTESACIMLLHKIGVYESDRE